MTTTMVKLIESETDLAETEEKVNILSELQEDDNETQQHCSEGWKLLFYLNWIHPFAIGALTCLIISTSPTGRYSSTSWIPEWFQIPALFPVPFILFTILGLCSPRREPHRGSYSRPFSRLFLCVVSKGTNRDALLRTWHTLQPLRNVHRSVLVYFVLDEPNCFDDMPCVMVPESFQTKHAKYKARALEYFRRHVKLADDDWVLHLDEESSLDEHALRSCIRFIEYTDYSFGQGVILYNQFDYWKRPFLTVADAVRVGDDMGRFHLQYGAVHRVIFGAHGSFLLTSGRVENDVTWETVTLTEDIEFAFNARAKGHTCGQVSGFLREQSPTSISDFVKQRRRWYWGILKSRQTIPRLIAVQGVLGIICFFFGLLRAFVPLFRIVPIPLWLGVCECLTGVTFVYLYLIGMLVQEVDHGTSCLKLIFHMIITLILTPLCQLLEALTFIYSIFKHPAHFDVIQK